MSKRRSHLKKFFETFVETESASGVLLFLCAIVAVLWANSSGAHLYHAIFETPITLGVGSFTAQKSLHHVINDALMVVFFLVVGLEIKREVLVGELSTTKQALLPVAAALGGMIVPALIYTVTVGGGAAEHGWAIPMATDIAFSLAVLSILGSRVPSALKILLTALAIVDDLGAVLVIALFYTSSLSAHYLGIAVSLVALLIMFNRLGLRHTLPYLIVGVFLWYAVLMSGVHSTIAGVLLAFTIPLGYSLDPNELVKEAKDALEKFDLRHASPNSLTRDEQMALEKLGMLHRQTTPPLENLLHQLHPWVAFLIMPLFALANSGITVEGNFLGALQHPVSLGVALGLVLGKPIGILAACAIAVKCGLAALPKGAQFKDILGIGILAGIGFTMSLFISGLAFSDPEIATVSKVGILSGSTISLVIGYLYLARTPRSDGSSQRTVQTH